MKARLKFRRRRAIIVVAIIAGLAAIGGVTGYLFTRGNDTAGATNVGQQQTSGNDGVSTNDGNNDQANNPSNNDGQSNDGQNAGNNGNAQGDGTTGNADGTNAGGTATDGARNAGGATAGTGATGGAGAAGTGGGTGTTGATTTGTTTPAGGDATTVYEQVQDNIVVENPWETHQVNWTPEDFSATIASAQNLNVNKRNFTVTKTAETSTGSNSVNVNDTITYKITITNTEERVLNSVYVRDQIPDGTELVEGSISDNGVLNGSQINWNLWDLNLQNGATKTVQFTVKVTESAKKVGTIKNTAYADNTPSEDETKNPVIESDKKAYLVGGEKETLLSNKDKVKAGQVIKYVITAKNNSEEVDGVVTISDSIPAGTELVEGSITNNGKLTDNTITWDNVTVNPGEKIEVSFEVTISENSQNKISNTAVVGGTNTPTTENEVYTDISGTKIWVDPKGTEHKDITINLLKDGEEVDSTTLKNGETTYEFNDLDKYASDGRTYEYTISEDEVDGYTTSIEGTTITNTIQQAKISVSGKKTWSNENGYNDVTRPDTITVNLLADGKQVKSQEVSADKNGDWTYTFSDLDKYDLSDGHAYNYTVTENTVENYTTTVDEYNITNRLNDEVLTPNITTEKKSEITSCDKGITTGTTVHEGDKITYTITSTNNGKVPTTVAISDTIDNHLTIDSVTATVDNDSVSGISADGNKVSGSYELANGKTIKVVIVTTVKDLGKDESGNDILTATISKNTANVKGTTNGNNTPDEENPTDDTEYTVVKPHITTAKTSKQIGKDGKDLKENEKLHELDFIEYSLTATNDGSEEGTATIKDTVPAGTKLEGKITLTGDSKEYTESELNKGIEVKLAAGETKAITFRVKIQPFTSATKTIRNADAKQDGKEVPPTEDVVEKEYTTISGTKTWVDGGKTHDNSKEVKLTLSRQSAKAGSESEVVENPTLTWNGDKYTFSGLDNYDSEGYEYTYSVKENEVAGYTTKQDGNNFTNTIKQGKVSVSGKKTWSNENGYNDVTRPDTITVNLLADGKQVKSQEVSADKNGDWTYTFSDLDKYDLSDGHAYNYTVTENTVENYTTTVDEYNITNRLNDEVLTPNITTEKKSEITSCDKGITTGTTVHEGDKITYTITSTNNGKVPTTVAISDTIDNHLTIDSVTATVDNDSVSGISADGNKVSGSYELANGKTIKVVIVTTVKDLGKDESGNDILTATISKNTANVKGTTNGNNTPDEENPTDDTEYTVVKPHITTAKTSKIASCENNITTGTTVHVGDEIEYTITINNDGTDSGTISKISDQIKDGLTYIKDSLTKTLTGENINPKTELSKITFDETTNKVILAENSNITLNAGSTLTIKFKAKVNDLGDGIYTGKIAANQVEVDGKTTPDDKGDYDVEKPEIESSKVVDKSTAKYGDELTYTITAKNKGNVSSDVTIEDKLPSGVEYKEGTVTLNNKSVSDNDCYNSDTKTIKYTTKLAANSTVTLEFKVKVTETKVGKNIVNTATVNGEDKTATTKTYKTISVTKQKDKPTDLILVLDISGSMEQSGEIANLKTAAKDLVKSVLYEGGNENSEVTLITYSSTATNLGSYRYKNLTELEGKISNLSATGGTNFAAALDKTIDAVESKDSIVVFLTDGAPTIPSDLAKEWYMTVGNIEKNSGDGFSNNTKSGIEERAKELNEKCDTIYAIGLGTDNLSENTYSYVEEVTGPQLDSDISFDTTNHTFTVKITNNNNYEVTLASASASIRNVDSISGVSDNGVIDNGRLEVTVNWSKLNKAIPANSSITLTGSYEASYHYWSGNESNPRGNVSATAKANNSNEEDDLYTQVNGIGHYRNKQYNVINTKKFAKYLLGKISSTGNVVETNDIKKTLNDIAEDIKPKSKTYTFDTNNTAEIPATENITKVSVTIGDTTKEYTVDQVKAGLENGLKYVEGKGFEWTLSDDLVKQDLAISYMYKD